MNWQELNKAIEKKAVEHLISLNFDVTQETKNAAILGFHEVITSYLTQEQIDEIVKIHKLEL
jgi:hypothetical protein